MMYPTKNTRKKKPSYAKKKKNNNNNNNKIVIIIKVLDPIPLKPIETPTSKQNLSYHT